MFLKLHLVWLSHSSEQGTVGQRPHIYGDNSHKALRFMGPCIVICFCSKTKKMHKFFWVYWISLYMFRTVFPSIVRSPRLYIQRQAYVIQVSWLLASGQSTNLYDIHLMLCVQSWTPDDERKDRPKHVVWYSINSKKKIVHLFGFNIEIVTYVCFFRQECVELYPN
jgi:hypothetical protein